MAKNAIFSIIILIAVFIMLPHVAFSQRLYYKGEIVNAANTPIIKNNSFGNKSIVIATGNIPNVSIAITRLQLINTNRNDAE